MKIVSKYEAKMLRERGFEHYVKSSHSKSKKYYVVEDQRALKELDKIRDASTK